MILVYLIRGMGEMARQTIWCTIPVKGAVCNIQEDLLTEMQYNIHRGI